MAMGSRAAICERRDLMTDLEALSLQEFLLNQVKGMGDVQFACLSSFTCVDGTVVSFDKPMLALIACTREAEPQEFEMEEAYAKQAEKDRVARANGDLPPFCACCGVEAMRLISSRIFLPYCARHAEMFKAEFTLCFETECHTWAALLPIAGGARIATMAFCGAHGGKTYQPHPTEES